MQLLGQFIDERLESDGSRSVVFKIWSNKPLLHDIDYIMDIKEKKSNRSIEQNKKYWAILGEIADVQGYTNTDELHLQMLEKSEAKVEIHTIPANTVQLLAHAADVRHIKIVNTIDIESGVKLYTCKVYLGSSYMNTKEMTKLIDTALDWASECGIETEEWRRILK